jgi:hypothetical protein
MDEVVSQRKRFQVGIMDTAEVERMQMSSEILYVQCGLAS